MVMVVVTLVILFFLGDDCDDTGIVLPVRDMIASLLHSWDNWVYPNSVPVVHFVFSRDS